MDQTEQLKELYFEIMENISINEHVNKAWAKLYLNRLNKIVDEADYDISKFTWRRKDVEIAYMLAMCNSAISMYILLENHKKVKDMYDDYQDYKEQDDEDEEGYYKFYPTTKNRQISNELTEESTAAYLRAFFSLNTFKYKYPRKKRLHRTPDYWMNSIVSPYANDIIAMNKGLHDS